ncbi:uncharacterized protein SCHCODRAFT_02660745 [Schizophyllum commune H4-8]|nr:uncharacterized protein SCHCODRAFT_02660745 [Schizophyllum commune H4-8]KAI5899076.1 hypothetical protein SCHCODRAFT_02660745 [Schizophyllum commune H4-8]
MDFELSDHDFYNTVLLDSTSHRAAYRTSTKLFQVGKRSTTLYRAAPDQPSGEVLIGTVMLRAFSSHEVVVNGRDVTPVRMGLFSRSETWLASDGRQYKWKVDPGVFTLVDDQTKEMIALFERHFFSTNKLCILPKGMHFVDEIVATVIYMDRVKRRRDRKESTI